jgi:hypothetical protein
VKPAPNLEGLDRLAFREGVDIRPTLVRVLTDLYVQKPAHTAEEERHYTELVLRLIDEVDISTRAIVARKLATYPEAPAPVLRRLARDAIEVAEPVLKHSLRLTGPDLMAVIQDFGPRYAEVIAKRRPADPANAVAATAATAGPDDSDTVPAAGGSDIRLGELFLAADSAERRVILANLDLEIAPTAIRQPDPAAWARLEAAALQRRPDDFVSEIERALAVTPADARRIVEDQGGEPLLVAAKALAMPAPVLLRVLLFLNPVIGQSVPRVFDLAQLYDRLAPQAATRIIASLRETAPLPRRAAHRPLLWDDQPDRGRRPAASARTPAGQDSRGEPATPPGQRQATT